MPDIRHITTLDLPELAPYRTMRRPEDHIREGIFVAEGEKVVRRLLHSNIGIRSILLSPEWLERLTSESASSLPEQVPLYIAPLPLLETIVGFHLHQGIMAVGCVPESPALEAAAASLPTPHLLVALDGLVNSENVGVVVRNCAAFGVDGLIVGDSCSSPYLRRAVRNSMGTVFSMKVFRVGDLADGLLALRRRSQTLLLGAHPSGQAHLPLTPLTGSVCVIFGSEGDGLSPRIIGICDHLVAIPMARGVDSLNVASASAVLLYEVSRQRAAAAADRLRSD